MVRICDRRAGIGGDGLLRAVLAKHVDGWDGDGDLWFMDYRNADGSIAEMCGNGIRVFVRYLVDEGLAYGPMRAHRDPGRCAGGRVAAGRPDPGRDGPGGRVARRPYAIVTGDGTAYDAVPVDVGNPHAVSFTDDLAAVDLSGRTGLSHRRLPRRSERGVRPGARRAAPGHAGVRAWLGGDPILRDRYGRGRGRRPRRAGPADDPRPAVAEPVTGTGSTCPAGRSRSSSASRRT